MVKRDPNTSETCDAAHDVVTTKTNACYEMHEKPDMCQMPFKFNLQQFTFRFT